MGEPHIWPTRTPPRVEWNVFLWVSNVGDDVEDDVDLDCFVCCFSPLWCVVRPIQWGGTLAATARQGALETSTGEDSPSRGAFESRN